MVEAAAVAALLAWLYLALFHGMFWRIGPLLAPPPLHEHSKVRVALVVPARNEEATIAQTVTSLVEQDYSGPRHIWVVDHSSTDATAAVALRDGVTVLTAPSLAHGWTGKLWALSHGIEHAMRDSKPDYLLLTDADIVHAQDSLSGLIARAEAEKLDLVSVMVKLRCTSPAERLLVPAFVVSIRPYPAFSDIHRLIARTAFTQLRYSAVLLAGTLAGMGLLYVLPVAGTISLKPAAAASWAIMTVLYLPMIRFYRQPVWTANPPPCRRTVLHGGNTRFRCPVLDGTRRSMEGPASGGLIELHF